MEKRPNPAAQKVIALECSGRHLSVALARLDGTPLPRAEIFLDAGRGQSALLKDSCEKLLRRHRSGLKEIAAVAVCTGPGSFTGLRISVTFARTLAQALKVPLVGIPAFEVIASRVRRRHDGPLLVLIDSIGGQVFSGFFKAGEHRPAGSYAVRHVEELKKDLGKARPVRLAGEGALRYAKEIRRALGRSAKLLPSRFSAPRALELALLAAGRLRSGGRFPWEKVAPFYLRAPVAVERLEYRKKKPLLKGKPS